ncbi:MAG: TonB-dependent receptor [Paludibacter sp.]|jgi:iron complex outermembrane receptor protein|nr:TonB-dependent receptor [Paludibacter sp.]
MNKKLIFSALSLLLTVNFTFAQQKTDSNAVELKGVTLTQQRVIYTPPRIVNVIDFQEIEKLPVSNIDQLLETITGIDIRNRGVGGTQSDISIRGGSFDQVLVLLNGVNITDPQTGHYNLDIPVELADVARVEVLQGSAARLYGPNAFSGAINIVTRKSAEKSSISSQISGGSYNTFTQNLSAHLSGARLQTFVSASHKSSDGYISNTDYDIKNAFWQTTFDAARGGDFDLQLAYQEKAYGANGFYGLSSPNQFDHTKTFYGSLNWNLQKDNLSFNAQLYSRLHFDHYEWIRNSPVGRNNHLTNIIGGKFIASYSLQHSKFSAGVDLRNEHIFSTNLGLPLSDTVKNIFNPSVGFKFEGERFLPTFIADYSANFGKFYFSAGVSGTYSKQFDGFASGGIDAAYDFTNNFRLYASANSAVRLPTFTDLYYKSAVQRANPDLKPEKSQTAEIGAKYNRKRLTANVSTFYRWGTNVIDWVKDTDSTIWNSRNLTNVNAFGIDFSAEYQFIASFVKKISLSYSFLTLDKVAGNFDSKYALDYLKHKATVGVQHRIYRQLSAQWNFGFYDRSGNYTLAATEPPHDYEPFFMADIRLQWLAEKYSIYLDINNLTNQNYCDFGGLPQPARNFMAGVKLKL